MQLIIEDGASASNVLDNPKATFRDMTIFPPSSLGGITTVEVSPRREAESVAADWITLTSGGSAVTLTASEALPLTVSGWGALRIATDTPPSGATEVFEITGTPNKD